MNDISIDTPGKENYYFPLHEERQLEIIDFPFKGNLTFNAYNEESNKALTYLTYDSGSIFKSVEPLELDL